MSFDMQRNFPSDGGIFGEVHNLCAMGEAKMAADDGENPVDQGDKSKTQVTSRVVIAMSGGVDSSVCAALMHEEGFECIGMTMRLWKGEEAEGASCSDKSCCGAESVEDARLVCDTLGIPFFAINFREEFWNEVVSVFAEEYHRGRTPSPCILCNEKLKFDTLYKKAVRLNRMAYHPWAILSKNIFVKL